jgi:Fe-S oxidoreductase
LLTAPGRTRTTATRALLRCRRHVRPERPADSLRFLDAKMGEIAEAGVDAIVTGNPGCLLQFRQGVQRAQLKGVRVLHTAEVVAERMQR